jgi:hypothetical protein
MLILEISNDFRTFVTRVGMVAWKYFESVTGQEGAVNIWLESDIIVFQLERGVDEIGDDGFDGRGSWEINFDVLSMNPIIEADDKCGRVVNLVTDVTIMYRLDGVAPPGGPEGRYIFGYEFCLIATRDLRYDALELSLSSKFFDHRRLCSEKVVL